MEKTAILLNYDWCTGCHSCEIACQMEHGYKTGRSGLVVNTVGPWDLGDGAWQYDNTVQVTKLCDQCAARRSKGKPASCQQHCQANCLKVGPLGDLAREAAEGNKNLLLVI